MNLEKIPALQNQNVQITRERGRVDRVSFEWDSFEAFLEDEAKIAARDVTAARCVKGMSRSWVGHSGGYEGVRDSIANGWPELREELARMMEGIELELPVFPAMSEVRRRKRHFDDHGDSLHMDKVWRGDLEHAWTRMKKSPRITPNTKRVTLAFEIGAHCGVSNGEAMWRAALCVALADSLARAGRVFDIWIIHGTSAPFKTAGAPAEQMTAWMVKGTNDPLNLDRLCSMVSISFLRTMGFMAYSAHTWEPNSHYGFPTHRGLPPTLQQRKDAGEVVIRIARAFNKCEMLDEYKRCWEEVEAGIAAHQQKETAMY